MEQREKREVWKDSLRAMRTSLLSSYDMGTAADEERKFLTAWENGDFEHVVFCDYRRNEGRRRLRDIMEVIDEAIEEIDCCESNETSALYLDALKTVALFSKWAKVLETSAQWYRS